MEKENCIEGDCPKCAGQNLSYGKSEIEENCLCYEYVCEDCDFKGIEWYSLAFIKHTDRKGIAIHKHEDKEVSNAQ